MEASRGPLPSLPDHLSNGMQFYTLVENFSRNLCSFSPLTIHSPKFAQYCFPIRIFIIKLALHVLSFSYIPQNETQVLAYIWLVQFVSP